ncbi:uncharacterized protein LOC109826321 [Asparagus officinalis]|uniref:uncharacterized protein LOC109826321 n=1 Tax=Asparagus officinalis TaxID=4686 RepID=UPI00098E05BB|nr:uncharacterized protein LOC109826321 [Asparagus officinalis]
MTNDECPILLAEPYREKNPFFQSKTLVTRSSSGLLELGFSGSPASSNELGLFPHQFRPSIRRRPPPRNRRRSLRRRIRRIMLISEGEIVEEVVSTRGCYCQMLPFVL